MAIARTVGETAGIVEQAFERFVGDVAAALPRVIAGLVLFALAVVGVKVAMVVVRAFLGRAFANEHPVYRQYFGHLVGLLLWFGVALAFLSVLGLGRIAAALGTASGFVALGVAYALSGMIEDAVTGIYLLRDPTSCPATRSPPARRRVK